MISVKPLTDEGKTQFEKLFSKYYSELDCGENVKHLVDEYILPDLLAGLIRIELLKDGDTYAGFVIYQKDDIDNEWNFKEGWGGVREIYVIPSKRRKGYGKFLLYTAELKMRESGLDRAYCLPCDGAEKFLKRAATKKAASTAKSLTVSSTKKPTL